MAEKRMITKSTYTRKTFLQLSPTARDLYTYLSLYSDNDGITEAYYVMQITKGSESDLFLLEQTGYIKVLDPELRVYIHDWQEANKRLKDTRGAESIYRPLLVSVLPEIEDKLFDYGQKKQKTDEFNPQILKDSNGIPL